MHSHLGDNGRIICTFHNPSVRFRRIDDQIRLPGKYSLRATNEILFLSSFGNYNENTHKVTGTQFYEVFSERGELKSKHFVDLEFILHTRQTFEALAAQVPVEIDKIYGDYDRTKFDIDSSPFIIFILKK